MKLVPLTVDDVVTRWEWLRQGILCCTEKAREQYLPEDVYCHLRGNTAWAFALRDDNDDDFGFAVLQNEHDPHGVVMFIWVLWCEPTAGARHKQEIYDELDKLAIAAKAKRIRMQSSRPGWGREDYFKAVAVIYEREVKT